MAISTVDTGGSVGRFGVVKNNIVSAGSSQAGAFPLGNHVGYFEVATVASGTGVVLPTNRIPAMLVVKNAGANSLSVYPPPGSAIDNGTVNAAYSLAAGSTCMFWANSLSNWYSAAYGAGGGGATTGLVITQHSGVITTDTPSAGAVTLDLSASDAHKVPMVVSTTITLANPPSGKRQGAVIYLVQGGSGSCVPTFSPAVNYGTAGTPAWSTTNGKVDILVLDWDGTTYRASAFGLGF